VFIFAPAVPLFPKEGAMESVYRVAGIDVHKKMLAVVVADVSEPGEYQFERCTFGAGSAELRRLADWLNEQGCARR